MYITIEKKNRINETEKFKRKNKNENECDFGYMVDWKRKKNCFHRVICQK